MHAIYFECPRDFTLLSFSGFGDSANGSVSMIFVHINYSQVSRLSHVPGGGGGGGGGGCHAHEEYVALEFFSEMHTPLS
jgi:hypothetical protein